jgi:hypothetical protein
MLLIVGGHSAVSPGMQMTFAAPAARKSKRNRANARSGETTDLARRALSPAQINLSNNNAAILGHGNKCENFG